MRFIICRARSMVSDITITNCGASCKQPIQRMRWCSPPNDTWKINFDGAFLEKEKAGAWGFVARDHGGQAVLAGAGRLTTVNGALYAQSLKHVWP
ncbi:hypothetical protein BAE44_0025928 [Dichanthelium oligosanthes]|uniref:Uncharacterized protein n=1 Tax=Dichanthelium oligosanthes TaxID=888268 RepID=A0A1E5UJM8_9POAL|nr:hypothetical protein BAE44_0025928 [Dichanthelium oligosanthes]